MSTANRCTGTVVDKYTEYEPGVGITSGNVTIPTGSTRYYLAIERGDGEVCAVRAKKQAWLQVRVGDRYGEEV